MPKKDKPEIKSENPKIITLSPSSPPPGEDPQPRKFNESVLWNFLQANEYGDAQLFIHLQKDKFIYDHAARQWYYWNDHYWRQDIVNQVVAAVDAVIEIYGEEMMRQDWNAAKARKEKNDNAAESSEKKAKAYRKRIELLQTLKRREIVVRWAAMGVDGLTTPGDKWDVNPGLLCCKNGIIDLKTGDFKPGEQSQMMKTSAPTMWDGLDALCPVWEEFIRSVFSDDTDLINYVQKMLGFFITGDTSIHIMPFFWGEGRNGKGTLLETIGSILGDYAGPIESETLLQQRFHRASGSATSDIMALRGKRLVWASETDEGRAVSGAKIKWLSGGDCLTGREVYGRHSVTFKATHHAILMTNNKPQAPSTDFALWRRVRLIPFLNCFIDDPDSKKPNEKKEDRGLLKKLKNEASGILAWLVRGHLLFQQEGFQTPGIVLMATEEYQKEEDRLLQFKEECIQEISGARIQTSKCYEEYCKHCERNHQRPMKSKTFYKEMKSKYETIKNNVMYYKDISLLSEFSSQGHWSDD
jgi:putative DNA primase/helicase